MSLTITSSAFTAGDLIPRRYTRDGENLSPPLAWAGVPAEARSLVLVVEDPDAPSGIFRHWAMYNIVPDLSGLPEGASQAPPPGIGQAVNDFGQARYDGPQPPKGHGRHHYHFRLAALDVPRLNVPSAARVEDVWNAARPDIIAQAELIGLYER